MSDLLQLVVSEGASDLHVRVGTPPTIRVHGILHRVEGPALVAEDKPSSVTIMFPKCHWSDGPGPQREWSLPKGQELTFHREEQQPGML